MAGRYGMSFARKLVEQGDYEEALAAATKEIDEGGRGPEPLFDRATALDLLERHADAVKDFEQAITVNKAEKELDPFMLDDAYFSALVAASREVATRDKSAASRMFERYVELLPDGAHVAESRDWQKRVRGEMPTLLDRTRDLDAV